MLVNILYSKYILIYYRHIHVDRNTIVIYFTILFLNSYMSFYLKLFMNLMIFISLGLIKTFRTTGVFSSLPMDIQPL